MIDELHQNLVLVRGLLHGKKPYVTYFHALLMLSPKFRHSSTSYKATCWHRKKACPAVARQRLFEMVLHHCRHGTPLSLPVRLESCTDARLIRAYRGRAARSIWSDPYSHILPSFDSGRSLLVGTKENGRDNIPYQGLRWTCTFCIPQSPVKGLDDQM